MMTPLHRVLLSVATTCVLTLGGSVVSISTARAAPNCSTSTSSSAAQGGFAASSNGVCDASPPGLAAGQTDGSSPPPPPTEVVDCGATPVQGVAGLPECQGIGFDCNAQQAAAPAGTVISVLVTYTIVNAVAVKTDAVCGVRAPGTPALSEVDVRAEVVKLVPAVAIRAAPNGQALVGLESLFWVDTTPTRQLGPLTLLAHQVTITITVKTVNWNFGDDTTDTSTGPGRPFTPADHCGENQCPDWFGHTYTETGPVTTTADVTWNATYTVDGGPPQPIIGTVTGPRTTMKITVKQARAVLVPSPTG